VGAGPPTPGGETEGKAIVVVLLALLPVLVALLAVLVGREVGVSAQAVKPKPKLTKNRYASPYLSNELDLDLKNIKDALPF
jgi:hypothetical protein